MQSVAQLTDKAVRYCAVHPQLTLIALLCTGPINLLQGDRCIALAAYIPHGQNVPVDGAGAVRRISGDEDMHPS